MLGTPAADLADLERDAVWCVVRDESRVPKAINEVFRAKVVWIAEARPEADNANANAACVASFSRRRCHGFIANNRLRLGTGCRTTSLMPFPVPFDIPCLPELFWADGHQFLAGSPTRASSLPPPVSSLRHPFFASASIVLDASAKLTSIS